MKLVKAVASESRYGRFLILLPRPAKEASKQVGHEISEASISTVQSILRVYPQNTSALVSLWSRPAGHPAAHGSSLAGVARGSPVSVPIPLF